MKKFVIFFLFLFVFLKIDIFAYDFDVANSYLKSYLNQIDEFDPSKDYIIYRYKNFYEIDGKFSHRYLIYNMNFVSRGSTVIYESGNSLELYLSNDNYDNLQLLKRQTGSYVGGLGIYSQKNSSDDSYSYHIDDDHGDYELVEANVVLEDLVSKKKVMLERKKGLIGLLIQGMLMILKIITEILIMGVLALISVLSLIGLIKYLKRLLIFRRIC